MSHNNNINRRIYNTIQLYNIYRTEIPTDTSNLRNWETPHSKRPVITQAHRLGYETMAVSKRLVVSVVFFFLWGGSGFLGDSFPLGYTPPSRHTNHKGTHLGWVRTMWAPGVRRETNTYTVRGSTVPQIEPYDSGWGGGEGFFGKRFLVDGFMGEGSTIGWVIATTYCWC